MVLRGLSFLGDALAHGVIPGIALAVLWGFDLTLGALATAAVMVGGITFVNRRARLPRGHRRRACSSSGCWPSA